MLVTAKIKIRFVEFTAEADFDADGFDDIKLSSYGMPVPRELSPRMDDAYGADIVEALSQQRFE